jgi:hypothetical protein
LPNQLTVSVGGFGTGTAPAVPEPKLQPICVGAVAPPHAPISQADPDEVPVVLPVPFPSDPEVSWYACAGKVGVPPTKVGVPVMS